MYKITKARWQFTTDGGAQAGVVIPTAARGVSSLSYMVLEDAANHQIRYVPLDR